MLQKFASEYSIEQDAFHYDQLYTIIARNKQMIEEGISNDYQIIGIFDTADKAMEYNAKFREELNLSDKSKNGMAHISEVFDRMFE